MRTLRHLFGSALTVAALVGLTPAAHAQIAAGGTPIPYSFSVSGNTYTETFSTVPNWSQAVIDGVSDAYGGTTAAAGVAATRFSRVPTNATAPNLIANGAVITQAGPANINFPTTTASGVQRNVTVGSERLELLASGTAGNTLGLDLYLDFSSRNANTIQFDWTQVNNTGAGDTRNGILQVYATTNGTTFTKVGPDINVVGQQMPVQTGTFSTTLPSVISQSATARIRFYYTTVGQNTVGGGARPKIAIDNISITAKAFAPGAPAFFAPTAFATGTTVNGVAATGLAVGINGSDLTTPVTVTSTSSNFQVSLLQASGYGSSVVLTPAGTGLPPQLFVRLNPSVAGALTGTLTYASGEVGGINVTNLTGLSTAAEPTTQAAISVTSATSNSITLAINAGNGEKVLIIGRLGSPYSDQTGFQLSNQPVDGTAYTASNVFASGGTVGTVNTYAVSNALAATTSVTITGLTGNTQYAFAAFAYNDGVSPGVQNYLATGIPVVSPTPLAGNVLQTTTAAPPPVVYTWVGAANAAYNDPNSWSPVRTTPLVNDELVFPNGTSTVTMNATETIGGLTLGATSNVTFTVAATQTLTIANPQPGDDFAIPAGATLRLRTTTNGTGLNITVASGSTGTITGTLDINGSSLTVLNNALFTGTGTVNVVSGGLVTVGAFAGGASVAGAGTNFLNGSTLTKNGGSSPTATFQSNSTFNWNVNGTLSFSGRTYGNLNILDYQNNASQIGAGLLTINNFTFSATGKTLNLNLTGGMVINGNLNITAGILNFLPGSGSLTFNSPTATVTSSSPITFSGLTLNKPNGPALVLEEVLVGAAALTLGNPVVIGTKLTLANANLVSNGNLTLGSNATRTAYVHNSGTGIVTGNATAQRATDGTGTPGVGYRFYSTPVSGATVDQFNGVLTPAYNTNPAALPFPTVFTYDPTRVLVNTFNGFSRGYKSPTTGDPLVTGLGYTVYRNSSTVELTGILNTGNKGLTLTGNGALGVFNGWNLLGNPYPSALDWSSAALTAAYPSATNADRTAFVTKPTGGLGYIYVQFNGTPAATNKELPMAQGFLVRKKVAGADLNVTLTNAMRVTTGDGAAFNRAIATFDFPALHITLSRAGLAALPEANVYFVNGAATGLDVFDSPAPGRSGGDAPTLLTLAGGQELAVNYQAELTAGAADVLVPVLIATPVAAQYKLNVPLLTNFPAGTQVLLEDAITGLTTDLSQNPAYSFYSDANYAGQRFKLRFTAGRVTGLATDLSASALSVFPNPASGTVRISAAAGSSISIIDALGRTVRTARIDAAGTERTIALNGLKAGLYTVRAGAASQKLVIE